MADSNRIRGSIGDCEGEGGERGERGKRGKRGHRGPRGPSGDEGPPFWPPFPVIAPGNSVTTTIYARVTGNDTTGDGKLANPYRTFARAIRDVPEDIDPGFRFIVDITGIGVETLPQDWSCPPIQSASFAWFPGGDPESPVSYFQIASALTVRAIPQLASVLSPADAVISAADGGAVSAFGPDLVQLTIATLRASWVPGSLKGLQVAKTGPNGLTSASVIFDNTTTDLFLTNDPALFNGGVGPLVLAPGEEVQILEPSATLQAPPAANDTKNPMEFSDLGAINFQGIHFTCTIPNAGFSSIGLAGVSDPFFELCVLDEIELVGSGALQVGMIGTTIHGFLASFDSRLFISQSLLDGVGTSSGFPFFDLDMGGALFTQTVFDGCAPIGTSDAFGIPNFHPETILMEECLIKNALGDAISIISPTRLDLFVVEIDGSLGNAINVDGPCKMILTDVTGSGNGGYGVIADDGAHVQVDAATTVTGTLGDTKSGSLGMTTYAQVAAGLAFDIPNNAASAQVATGTRIFTK